MEIQVQELIDKIKKDGINAASSEASKIRAEAESEAKRVLESAKKEAEDIINRGKQNAERDANAGNAALRQASRNLILAFKDEVSSILSKIINDNVSANYGDDVLKAALPELLKSWAAKGGDDLAVILPENELSRLGGFFREKLAKELSAGAEIRQDRKLTSGFRISNKEGSSYYDFSAEAVARLLSSYLNPKLSDLVKEVSKGI